MNSKKKLFLRFGKISLTLNCGWGRGDILHKRHAQLLTQVQQKLIINLIMNIKNKLIPQLGMKNSKLVIL